MIRTVLMGTAAGAVGTVALNVATYADMAIRGRPSSSMPGEMVGTLAQKVGVDLSGDGEDDEQAQNRKSGLGALSGYVVGLGVGTAYGLLHLGGRDVPVPVAAIGLSAVAMAGSDVPLTALGLTNPAKWPASSWASDIIPHLAYGLFAAVAFDAFTRQ
jgi:hypothetical protein